MSWLKCPDCDEYWCTEHHKHVFECDCPAIEEWDTDPYEATDDQVINAA